MTLLYVTLTNTTNEYLKPRLPLRGFLNIHEFTVGHTVNTNGATFHAETPDGKGLSGTAVIAPDAEFFCDRAYPSRELLDALNRRDGKGRWARHEGNTIPESVTSAKFLWAASEPNAHVVVHVDRHVDADGLSAWRDRVDGAVHDATTIDAWEPAAYAD